MPQPAVPSPEDDHGQDPAFHPTDVGGKIVDGLLA